MEGIQKYGSVQRLLENQKYTISFDLPNGKKVYNFTSKYSPLFSSVKIIRSDFPELFKGISDDEINYKIWENSLLTFEIGNEDLITVDGDTTNPTFASKQYVRYKTQYDLLKSILLLLATESGSEQKFLGELQITKEVAEINIKGILDILEAELKKWEDEIGSRFSTPSILGAVKGGTTNPFPLNGRVSF